MNRIVMLTASLSLLVVGVANAQYPRYYQQATRNTLQPVVRPRYQTPITPITNTRVTTTPYYAPVGSGNLRTPVTVARPIGVADTQPTLVGGRSTAYRRTALSPGCGSCGCNALHGVRPTAAYQPVGVPSLGAYGAPQGYAPAQAYGGGGYGPEAQGYNVGNGLFGSPKFYRTGEPVRNLLRYLTL